LATKKTKAEKEAALAILKSTYPLRPFDIAQKIEEIKDLERGMAVLMELEDELF
jgi:hypothetical protein